MARWHGISFGSLPLCLWLLLALPAMAQSTATQAFSDRLSEVFAEATEFGALEGTPPAVAAYRDGQVIGYAFSTRMVVASVGYAGKPLDILAGVDLEGRLTGAVVLEHSEPILVIGVADEDLAAFVAQYRGIDIRDPVQVAHRGGSDPGSVDAVSGASISSVVLNDAILRSARAVARSRGIVGGADTQLDFDSFETTGWDQLLAEGSLANLTVTVAEAESRLAESGAELFDAAVGRPDPDAAFLELFAGLATPARVGRNLLGDRLYNRAMAELAEGDQLIFVAGRGLYSFKGTAWVRGGVFDRLQLVQGPEALSFHRDDHRRIEKLAIEGAPELRELALFAVRQSTGFSPAKPWRLELLLMAEGADGSPAVQTFTLPYSLPAVYRQAEATGPLQEDAAPLWHRTWLDRKLEIAVLAAALIVLTAILVLEDVVARRKRVYEALRIGFLLFTLVWLGWIAGAQLSVLHVLTFANAMMTEFSWGFFLLDPLMFILWSFVAVTMLFLGRGVFCGWLCPFGALQELVNRAGKWARVPQWRLPFVLHERLWPIKYIIFLAIFAIFLGDLPLALEAAEVEPFKTAIVLRFDRTWPYLLFALGLLAMSLFVSRAYCRYICPLGAALAVPARMRMFDWLKRRWHCGKSCHHCADSCPVQAIHPTGQINPNECIYCLRCQVNYFDDSLCPPMIEQRRREQRAAAKEATEAEPGRTVDGWK